MEVQVILNGPGRVGMNFARLLLDKADYLRDRTGCSPVLRAVVSSKGTLYSKTGLTLPQVLRWRESPASGTAHNGTGLRNDDCEYLPSESYEEILRKAAYIGPGVVVEATPTDIRSGQPGLDHLITAMNMGFSAITLAKGPLVVSYEHLVSLATQKNVSLKYSGAVAAALPTVDTALYSMAGSEIVEIEGVLNGTTNYILNSMASGKTYGQALAEAQSIGVAESNPTLDVEGFDSAAKLLILANTIWGLGLKLRDVEREGITGLSGEEVRKAAESGTPIRLLASAKLTGDQAGSGRSGWGTGLATCVSGSTARVSLSVKPCPIPAGHPFHALPGTSKAVRFSSKELGDVVVSGGASDVVGAAASALKDLIHIFEERFSRHAWP
ncbi:MAG TPA: hypothetical protein GXX23_04605 [Firmicutes bacterium]|nr:hypothetical protein [Candidatus Fermentithermobacillaceae bacterium]